MIRKKLKNLKIGVNNRKNYRKDLTNHGIMLSSQDPAYDWYNPLLWLRGTIGGGGG